MVWLATPCQFLEMSNHLLQRKWPDVMMICSLTSLQLILRSSRSSIVIAQVCARYCVPTSSTDDRLIVLRRTQMAYLGLQVAGGHIGLVVVLVHSIFSNRIRRDPTYINFCITWIFSSVAFSLLSASVLSSSKREDLPCTLSTGFTMVPPVILPWTSSVSSPHY